MQTSNNTILITGGGSGIGRALAEAFHRLGNDVIIAGRRREVLDAVAAANPGMKAATLEVQDPGDVRRFVDHITRECPALNVLINNAGIMKLEDLSKDPIDMSVAEDTLATNLLAPMRLTAALLPLLKKQTQSTIVNVSSGLAFLTLAQTPTYCATKAAIHAYSDALRYQLRNTSVGVVELVPPYLQTGLMGDHQTRDPRAMPLAEFIDEVMNILQTQPDAQEVLVNRVLAMRQAGEQGRGKYQAQFREFNDAFAAGAD